MALRRLCPQRNGNLSRSRGDLRSVGGEGDKHTRLAADEEEGRKVNCLALSIDTSSLFIFRHSVGRFAYLQSGFPSPLPLDICSFDYCAQLNIKRDLCPRRLRSFFMFIQ
jgi:hypothetical protein